jgi:hypothetical protein
MASRLLLDHRRAQKETGAVHLGSQVNYMIREWPVEWPRNLVWSYDLWSYDWEGDPCWVGRTINDECSYNMFATRLSGPLHSLRVVWDGRSAHLLWAIVCALRKMDAAPDAPPLQLIIDFEPDETYVLFLNVPTRMETEFSRVSVDAMLEHLVRSLQFEGMRDLGELLLVIAPGRADGVAWLAKTSQACDEWGVGFRVVVEEDLGYYGAPDWLND